MDSSDHPPLPRGARSVTVDAFVAYSRGVGELLAPRLQAEPQSIAEPSYQRRTCAASSGPTRRSAKRSSASASSIRTSGWHGGLAVAATLVAVAVAATPAAAAVQTFGSDLTAPANLVEKRQASTVFWQSSFADGRSLVAPASGQVRLVRIKGIALSDRTTPVGQGPPGGEREFHIQVMRPLADGTFQIRNPGGTSGFLMLPGAGTDPQTVTSYSSDATQPYRTIDNLCVQQGDRVVLNAIGGWDGIRDGTGPYPDGTPLEIFSVVADDVVSEFTGSDATNNGAIIQPTAGPNRELLMQVTVGTGPHATALCPGGTAGPEGPLALDAVAPLQTPTAPARAQQATIPAKQRLTVSKNGKVSVALFCLPGSARCVGTLRIMSRGAPRTSLGVAQFTIAATSPGHATIFLDASGRTSFERSGGRLPVELVAETNPGGASRRSTLLTTLRRRGS